MAHLILCFSEIPKILCPRKADGFFVYWKKLSV